MSSLTTVGAFVGVTVGDAVGGGVVVGGGVTTVALPVASADEKAPGVPGAAAKSNKQINIFLSDPFSSVLTAIAAQVTMRGHMHCCSGENERSHA